MAPKKSTRSELSSEAADFRQELLSKTMPFLQSLAWHALNKYGRENSEVALACIHADSLWRHIVERFIPSHDWKSIRSGTNGKSSVIVGCFDWEIFEIIADHLPDLADIILTEPRKGFVHAVVLACGGGTVYEITPKEQRILLH